MSPPSPFPAKPETSITLKKAGFFRRAAALAYDSLLLAAVLFAATAAILPLNHGEAFAPDNFYYPIYLILVSFLFYGWFWTHGGQTLGLRAWKLRVLTFGQQPITWQQALCRFLAAMLSFALLGLGFLWIIVDKNKCGWHDSLSKTTVYHDDSRNGKSGYT
ncbi:MAG: RDD family protein [Gammaproteobacteria bacterium HGW-Gammaproteobacteria-3]|nr:MAG: RDD family protein [Gammaproteobacteria bacterium HGW-Gammaproteobacteria-3]